MSYAQRVVLQDPLSEDLAQRLAEEFRHPQGGVAEPVILLENQGQQDPARLYVIWNEWGHLTQLERSEIALEAYRQARGAQSALKLRVALGLTPDEAGRMGIAYAPLGVTA